MGLPTVRASGAWSVGTTSPSTATLPTHASGDLLILEAASTSSGSTVGTHGTPSGWTLIGTFPNSAGTRRGRVSVFARKATSASETNPGVTFSTTGTSYQLRARAHSITAGTWNDTGTLANAWEDVTTAQGSDSSTLAFSGFATTGTNRLGWASVHQCDDTATGITNGSSYTVQGANSDSATGSDGYSSTQTKNLPSSGSADVTFTFTAGGSITTLGILFGIIGAVTDDRTGTGTTLSASSSLSSANGAKAVSATVASLSASSSLGTSDGTRDVQGSGASLTATESLGATTGTRDVPGTSAALEAAAALGTADGVAASGESRNGTGTALDAASSLGTPAGERAVSGTLASQSAAAGLGTLTGARDVAVSVGAFSAATALGSIQGYATRSGTAAVMAAVAELGTVDGDNPAGPDPVPVERWRSALGIIPRPRWSRRRRNW